MSESGTERAAGGKLGIAIAAFAILVSLAVTAVLVPLDLMSMQQLRVSRALASEVPPAGKLLGRNALDDSEWAPPEGRERTMVVFGLSEPGRPGDMDFWHDIVLRTRDVAPDVQFVGLCVTAGPCTLPPGTLAPFALLEAMDPLQTHALATATRRGQAFVYRGSRVLGTLPIQADKQAFGKQIADLSRRLAKTKAGEA